VLATWEGIDALASLSGRLTYDFDFRQSGDRKDTRLALLQTLGNSCGEVVEQAGDYFFLSSLDSDRELSISDLVIGFFAGAAFFFAIGNPSLKLG